MQWGWYKDTNTCKLFLHMILKANWKDGAYQGVEVPRGAFVSSYPELSQETGLSIQNIRTALSHLKSTGELTVTKHGKFSLFIVKNYTRYQASNMEINSEVTDDQHDSNTQLTTIKKNKNKKTKEIYTHARTKAKCRTTGFNNFQQRNYDFDALEQQLLQSQEV